MSKWHTVWHLAKWQILRARWWVLAVNALMLLELAYAAADRWDGPAEFLGYLLLYAVPFVAGITTTIDLTQSATAFDRGRPIEWWMSPLAKLVAAFAAVGVPALVLSAGVLFPYAESPLTRVAHVVGILGTTLALAAVGVVAGALSLPGWRNGALWLACYVMGFAVSVGLKTTKWQGMPLLLWLAVAAALILALSAYRRRWSQRTIAIGVLAISQLFVVATTKAQLNSSDFPPDVVSDSIRMLVDSVVTERSHLARVAFTVETEAPIDAVELPSWLPHPGGATAFLGLERLGRPSEVVIRASADSVRTLTFSDPQSCHAVSLANGAFVGGHGEPGRQVLFDPPDARGIRRAHAIAVVALRDSAAPPDFSLNIRGTVIGLRAQREAVLPLRLNATSNVGAVHWRVRYDSTSAGISLVLARSSLRAPWTRDTSVRGWYSDRHIARAMGSRDTVSIGRYTSNVGSTSIMALPGVERRQVRYRLCSAPASLASDTVEILRLTYAGRFGFGTVADDRSGNGAHP